VARVFACTAAARLWFCCNAPHAHTAHAAQGADCVWHIAALVGPYYEHQAYYNVNYTCAHAPRRQRGGSVWARACAELRGCVAYCTRDCAPPRRDRGSAASHAPRDGPAARRGSAALPARGALASKSVAAARALPSDALRCAELRATSATRSGTLNVIEACKRHNVRRRACLRACLHTRSLTRFIAPSRLPSRFSHHTTQPTHCAARRCARL
jgi:hypothetical protein